MFARVLLVLLVSAAAKKKKKNDKFDPLKDFNFLQKGMAALKSEDKAADKVKRNAHLKAFFVNAEKSTDRATCMSKQLQEQGIDSNRFSAVMMKECPDFDFKCMGNEVFLNHKDCFKSGADLIHLTQHGSSGKDASMKNRAMAVLANWCSHKRLFNQLSKNHSNFYSVKTLGEKFLKLNVLKQTEKDVRVPLASNEKVFIVLEDDAILQPNFAEKVNDFIANYPGKWDMLQLDTFGKSDRRDKVGEFGGFPVYHPGTDGDYFGLHCILIKESSIGKINLEMGLMPAVPVDWFPKLLKAVPDTKVLVWNPDIVLQPEMKTSGREVVLPSYCDQSIMKSTIGGE